MHCHLIEVYFTLLTEHLLANRPQLNDCGDVIYSNCHVYQFHLRCVQSEKDFINGCGTMCGCGSSTMLLLGGKTRFSHKFVTKITSPKPIQSLIR